MSLSKLQLSNTRQKPRRKSNEQKKDKKKTKSKIKSKPKTSSRSARAHPRGREGNYGNCQCALVRGSTTRSGRGSFCPHFGKFSFAMIKPGTEKLGNIAALNPLSLIAPCIYVPRNSCLRSPLSISVTAFRTKQHTTFSSPFSPPGTCGT